MADVGRTDFQKDIIPKKDSPIDLVRIATYINTIPAAVEMIEDCAKKGYETTINIMAVSKANTDDIKTALDILGQSPVNAFYIVDSYGALYLNSQENLLTYIVNMPISTARVLVFMLITISNLHLQILLKL